MAAMQLYQKTLAGAGKWPLPRPADQSAPTWLAAALCHNLSTELSQNPSVFREPGGRALTLLYKNACYACDDLLGDYRELMAALAAWWPLAVYGTVPGPETGEIRLQPGTDSLGYTLYSVSGKPFYTLIDLCVKVEPQTEEDAAFLVETLSRMDYRCPCCALPKSFERYAADRGLARPIDGAFYCYPSLTGDDSTAQMLRSLSIGQLTGLWRAYLEDGREALEFDWLLEAYFQKEASNLLEWELALQAALTELEISVTNELGYFSVTRTDGRAMRFDYASPFAAEKMFLKILFPVRPPARQ